MFVCVGKGKLVSEGPLDSPQQELPIADIPGCSLKRRPHCKTHKSLGTRNQVYCAGEGQKEFNRPTDRRSRGSREARMNVLARPSSNLTEIDPR